MADCAKAMHKELVTSKMPQLQAEMQKYPDSIQLQFAMASLQQQEVVLRAQQAGQLKASDMQSVFDRLDSNTDGCVTRAEFLKNASVAFAGMAVACASHSP
uniref:EF-hand domain-containing protein n=1 Tax=Haptolina ericina TaxID=156174 RepID=A0A7S3BZ84_9EUKA